MANKKRLVIISYRLPFKLIKEGRNYKAVQNSGGLVSAILSISEKLKLLPQDLFSNIAWVGVSEHTRRDFRRAQNGNERFELFPVSLSEEANRKFYEGFSNNLLWPLLHYFPSFAVFDDSYFKEYVQANIIFSDAVVRMLRPDDLVWIHDYHFMLLPRFIRQKNDRVPIGFFLHIPFPSFEIFRLLPNRWREPLLKGMLGADLIGFHTLDYAYHFLKTVKKVLNLDHVNRTLSFQSRKINTDAFPISIDVEKFSHATFLPEVEKEIEKLRLLLHGQKLIFSVDRLDYTKGIVDRLLGFELFLKEHPEWHEKVLFNLVVVPSRDEIPQYKDMHNQIDALAGRINSEYSTMSWRPILYQYKSLGFEEMIALYDMSDVGLITPIRDGMNLVAKEYVASQRHTAGVLILSEMAGAAAELQDAITINPTDKKEIAGAIHQAITMPDEERRSRLFRMQQRLREYDVFDWTTEFVQQLSSMKRLNKTPSSVLITPSVTRSILQDYDRANKRILFFDYDGTLVPFQSKPEQAIPDQTLIDILSRFCLDPKNRVVLISGRDKNFLEKWFGQLPVTLVAEHGAFTKIPGAEWMQIIAENSAWKESVISMIKRESKKYPGSFVEVKEQSIAWHFRNALLPAKEIETLKERFSGWLTAHGLQLLEGNKVIEVKQQGVDKGTAVKQFLALMKDTFMLAIGDDRTDEDLFHAIPPEAYTVKVGTPSIHARYYITSQPGVIKLLRMLLNDNSEKSDKTEVTTLKDEAARIE